MTSLLYALFFLSGAAGLMYESGWARYLGLFVGHEAYAQVLVLVIFLGGMSLGAMLVSRRADRLGNPLRAYAAIEAVIGIFGLAFHSVFVSSTQWAYDQGFPALAEGPGAALLKWGLAAGLILPQSILLGTTFPLMSAGVLRRAPSRPGNVLGWLYFTNSLGAALGVLIAGFLVVALFGLPGVMRTAGVLNLVVAALAWLLSRKPAPAPEREALPAAVEPPPDHPSRRLERILLASAFLTAIASFCYEIDWIRMLSLVLGSATHSFELMLSAFILGLALGAFWIRGRIDRLRDPLRTLASIQLLMGVLAVATLPVYVASFSWMAWLHRALNASGEGYALFTLARYAFCLAVMLPATFCAGMTLPLITRLLLAGRRSESAIGQVYAWNTLGSILGVVLAALLLLPLLGLKGLLVFAGLVDIGVGALILSAGPGRAARRLLAPLGAAGLALIPLTVAVDRRQLVSGVFRGADRLEDVERRFLDYYADGRTATVAVTRSSAGFIALSTNGKVDASLTGESQQRCDPKRPLRQIESDEVTQLLTAIIPLGYLRAPADAAVIGIGSGISTHTLLASPGVRSVTTVEIEPRMVDGARLFAPVNRRTFEDPRSRIVIGDARAIFAASGRRFGLIASEPSNPWVSGVSSLFTEEFYRRIRVQLTEDGIFAQWLQTYDLDDISVLRVLRAIDAVFPDWQVHQAGTDDIVILATAGNRLPPADWAAVAALPGLTADLCGVVPLDGSALETTVLADRTLLRGAARDIGPGNSDFFPLLDLQAERRRFEGENAEALLLLGDRWFNLSRQLMGRRETPVPMWTATFAGIRRSVERRARTWQDAAPTDSAPTPVLGRLRYEWRRWLLGLAAPGAPADWKAWTAEFQSVGRVRHAGTAGWIDERFFEQAMAYARRNSAPSVVRDVIDFRRAAQAWRAEEALAAAEQLGRFRGDLTDWIPVLEVTDVAVVAAVTLGRHSTARVWMAKAAELAARDADDIIHLILASLVDPLPPPP